MLISIENIKYSYNILNQCYYSETDDLEEMLKQSRNILNNLIIDKNVLINYFNENSEDILNENIIQNSEIFVYKALYKNENVIIKTSKNGNNIYTILLEYFIGNYGANKLYDMGNLNFTRMNGIFCCGTIKDNKICRKSEDKNFYLIYEYINGKSFKEFIKDCTIKEFLFYFIQILLSLKHANQNIDFTHYDLNTENIIMYDQGHEFYLKYGEQYCYSLGYIPKFIDYGMSHMKHENVDFGTNLYGIELNIFKDRSFIIYDVYKLLFDSLLLLYIKKDSKFMEVLKLMEYFTKTNLTKEIFKDHIIPQKDFNGMCMYCPETTNITNEEWDKFKEKYKIPNDYEPIKGGKLSLDEFIDFTNNICLEKFNESPINNIKLL